MLNTLNVILSFLKVGIIGFGGGAALIPVIENEIVEKRKWIDKKDFDFRIVVASISPGSLPVSFLAIWNTKYAVASAIAYAIPGPMLYVALLTGFSLIGEAGVRFISFASVGIISFVFILLYSFIKKSYIHGTQVVPRYRYIAVIVIAFLLSSGNVVRNIAVNVFAIDPAVIPATVFSLSMINMLLIAFFMILFIGSSASIAKFGVAAGVAVLYALAQGQTVLLDGFSFYIALVMIAMAIGSIIYDYIKRDKTQPHPKVHINREHFRNFAIFVGIGMAISALVLVAFRDPRTLEFVFSVVISTLTSFGGGEAYIAVADGLFVQTNFISAEIYYTQIVGLSSAMPGPLLMIIASSIGFIYGNAVGGVIMGWSFAFLALILAVVATAMGGIFLILCFRFFDGSHRLKMITLYIIPMVCGLLCSIALVLLMQASSVMIGYGVAGILAVAIVISIFLTMLFMRVKYKLGDIVLLLIGGTSTLVVLAMLF